MTKNVFLTGAFGSVGEQTLLALLNKGYNVTAFDVRTPATEKKQARLAKKHSFTTMWGDLRDAASTAEAVAAAKPAAILHIAAVIAPTAYIRPELAYAVNVGGTRNLIDAAKAAGGPRLVFTSSYSVHGPRSPHVDYGGPISGATPVRPTDNYGRHKVAGEQMLAESGLPYAVLRLPAVQSLDPNWGRGDEFLTFGFMIPANQPRNGCDVRDVALAFANSVEADIDGRTFAIGGAGEWNSSGNVMFAKTFEARGLKAPPESWNRTVDESREDVFYNEDHVHDPEAEALLQFQQHSMADYFEAVSRSMGAAKLLMPLVGGMVVNDMKKFAWLDQAEPDSRSLWEVVCETFGLDPVVQ